jgi:hypothetical protein
MLASWWASRLGDTDAYHIDHVHELQLGGADDLSNMGPMHARTNVRVGWQIATQLRDVRNGTRARIHVMGPS